MKAARTRNLWGADGFSRASENGQVQQSRQRCLEPLGLPLRPRQRRALGSTAGAVTVAGGSTATAVVVGGGLMAAAVVVVPGLTDGTMVAEVHGSIAGK
jgi:hypothetical protein